MYWGNNNCAVNAEKYDYPGLINKTRGAVVRRMNPRSREPYMTVENIIPPGSY